ncbi:MAG: carboxypeptidase-like regulatory domain-containing protein [Spirulinaceae cyanobacterium]
MKILLPLTSIGLCWLALSPESLAHQSQVSVERLAAVEITATYGSDQPMRQAQVSVYSPADLQTPWQTGQTNAQGQYRFIPDQDGDWEVKVRQAGHGVVMQVPVTQDVTTLPNTVQTPTDGPHESPLRQGLMALSVLWGCVGTAFFFSRKVQHAQTPAPIHPASVQPSPFTPARSEEV